MELNEYQRLAMTTCLDSCDNFSYMFINLVGEVGEFASKVAKQIRKENVTIEDNYHVGCLSMEEFASKVAKQIRKENVTIEDNYHVGCLSMEEFERYNDELKKEAGDVLWQLAGLCKVMGWKLEDVADMNLKKLAARKAAGTIDGSGDGIVRPK